MKPILAYSITMEALKYKLIKSKPQYCDYCEILENLVSASPKKKAVKEEIELLTLLIEKWDREHNTFSDMDPVELLHTLMEENNLKPKNLVSILGISKSLVSDILNYKKGFSKDLIRILADHFKVSQEAFNRPYRRHKSSGQLVYLTD